MSKKFALWAALWMWLAMAFAAVDVNQASAQELTQIKGIGEVTAERIIEERSNGQFKDWADLVERVKGVGAAKAQGMSDSGLTVNGSAYERGR